MIGKKGFVSYLWMISVIAIVAGGSYFLFLKQGCTFLNPKVAQPVAYSMDSLYHISYSKLQLNETAGTFIAENVRVIPDTSMIRLIPSEEWPPAILDISVRSIIIKGIQKDDAGNGTDISGDTVIIHQPRVRMYTLKPLVKNMKLESEVLMVYREMLGKLKRIRINHILIDSIEVESVRFLNGEKNFDLANGNIRLSDVLVDSLHHKDSTRVLFAKNAAFSVDTFQSYNNNREELVVNKLHFDGIDRKITSQRILLNRFNDAVSGAVRFIDAIGIRLNGVNTFEIIKHKKLVVDSIQFGEVNFYEPPKENLALLKHTEPDTTAEDIHPTGFRNVYGVQVKYLNFPLVKFVAADKQKFDVGKMKIQLHDINAGRISRLEKNPFPFVGAANLEMDYVKSVIDNGQYRFLLDHLRINSEEKNLLINEVSLKPSISESVFAAHHPFQKDQYDVSMKKVSLTGIQPEDIFNKRIIASELNVGNAIVRIFRDLNKPLEMVSRVGNYPSQMLLKLGYPVAIDRVNIPSAFVEYREHQYPKRQTGIIGLYQTNVQLTNVTNMPSRIAANNILSAEFSTSVLRKIPVTGNFKFFLDDPDGRFEVKGQVGKFSAMSLNPISIPMAMIRIRRGNISEINFDFKGNNWKASGPFSMTYDNLKIDILKKDIIADTIKRRGLVSLLANIVLQDSNPLKGEFRKETAIRDRNIYKSFFNLVWKTIFAGIKKTVGIQ